MISDCSTANRPPPEIPSHLWAEAWDSPNPCFRFDLEGRTLWLKKAQEPRGYWRYRFMNLVARRMRLPVLHTKPPKSLDEATACEADRIRQLEEAGIRVPEIIARGPQWLLLSHLGVILDSHLEESRTDESRRLRLMEATLAAVFDVHRKGQYLSQCFSRNVVIENPDDPLVGFIDFEEDPLEVMELHHAQSRDLLLLILSTVRCFEDNPRAFRELVRQHLLKEDADVRDRVGETLIRLRWLRRFPAKRRLGRDFGRLEATLRVFAG